MVMELDRGAPWLAVSQLAEDLGKPALSVSIGVSIWPADGTTLESLLENADMDLYSMKNRSRRRHVSPGELA